MAWEENNSRGEIRGASQRSEIGDVLLSARTVSRQMIARAQGKADETVRAAELRADEIVKEAEARADEIVKEAREKAAEILRRAEAGDADSTGTTVAPVEKLPADTAGEGPNAPGAECTPAVDVEKIRADAAAEAQEYAARCVETCLSQLRQRQQDTVDFINEQWQSFLCGLMLGGEPAPDAAREPSPEPAAAEPEETRISQQEIEAKVNAIASELKEIIG